MVDPHERGAGVLVAQYDGDEVVNKAADAQLEAEAALQCPEKLKRSANEIRRSNRELLERMRNLECQVLGFAQTRMQPRPMSSARQARREGTIYEPFYRHRNQFVKRSRAIFLKPDIECRVQS